MKSPFQFLDFQKVAVDLATKGGEPELRSAVSRLYYALFHVAKRRTGVTDRHKVHKKVMEAVRKRDRAMGDQLDKLKRLRAAADYDLIPAQTVASTNWQSNWQRASSIAARILPKLRSI